MKPTWVKDSIRNYDATGNKSWLYWFFISISVALLLCLIYRFTTLVIDIKELSDLLSEMNVGSNTSVDSTKMSVRQIGDFIFAFIEILTFYIGLAVLFWFCAIKSIKNKSES